VKRLDPALAAILACAVTLLLLPGPGAVQRDSGVFLYGGWRILHGGAPYVAFWDHKPPLIYLLNAVGLALGGVWGVWALEAAGLAIALACGWRIIKAGWGRAPAALALCAWAAGYACLREGGNLTECYAHPLQVLLLLQYAKASQRPGHARPWLLMGILASCLFLLRQNLIGTAVAVLAAHALRSMRPLQAAPVARSLGAFAAGVAAPLAVAAACLAAAGALPAFIDQAFTYNLAYASAPWSARAEALLRVAARKETVSLLALALAGWAAAAMRCFSTDDRAFPMRGACMATLLALPVETALACLSGRPYAHYALPMLPAMAILAAALMDALLRSLAARPAAASTVFRAAALAALAAALLALPLLSWIVHGRAMIGEARKFADTAAAIRQHTSPGAGVLVWGPETRVNFLARRAAPTRFAYSYPLETPGYTQPTHWREFLAALNDAPPAVVVLAQPISAPRGLSPGFDAFSQFIAARYTVAPWSPAPDLPCLELRR